MAFAKRLLSTRCSVLMPSYIRIANAWHLLGPWHLHGTARRCAAPVPLLPPVVPGALRVRLVYALAATLDLSSTKEAGPPHSARVADRHALAK
jgi:hypothetical protein